MLFHLFSVTVLEMLLFWLGNEASEETPRPKVMTYKNPFFS